ncbi:MAG: hypothetical protein Phyf2KO_01530 [Phycisphaerales bacterium]
MRVLGIDPGLRLTGFGCIDGPAQAMSPPSFVDAGVIRLVSSGSPTPSVQSRLVELERDLTEIVDRNDPDLIAVEALFTHKEHPFTAVLMAHARGVILLVAQRSGKEIVELPPADVKRAVAGSGRATKEQMQASATRLLGLAEPPRPADIADALCIAIAARQRAMLPAGLGGNGA